ncbi:DUF3987 domain-containing protein [Candidatus Bipolaricaulota bacterium]|nr:DUF3987 domain-containing protein [Candidatus Bipolaricaulota bacterium]
MSELNEPEDILGLLENVSGTGQKNQYVGTCPAHDDSTPSLSVKLKEDKVLLDCKAGCSTESVVEALGLEISDLSFNGHKGVRENRSPDIVETYDYKNENGERLFQVCRKSNKDFRLRRKVGRDWKWSLKNDNGYAVQPVLYYLPEVLEARDNGDRIYVVEGEKDADNLREHNFVATCNPMGADSWKDLHTAQLEGAKVIIIPDADKEGLEHAIEVANELSSVAASLKLIKPEKLGFTVKEDHGKDISDWLEAGHTAQELNDIVDETDTWSRHDGDRLIAEMKDRGGRKAELIELVEDVKMDDLEGVPTFPIEAADLGVIGEYVNWLKENSEEPPSFSFAAFRNLLGLAVGRELTVEYGGTNHSPIFFDVLIGKSSLSRKSNTINTAHDIIDHSLHTDQEKENFKTINGIGSAEGLLEAVESTEQHVSGDHAKAVLLLDEFSSITDKIQQSATQNIQSQIIELWDLKPKIEHITRQNSISIEKPTTSVLAGTTVENIKGEVNERVKRGGFFNRFCWWCTKGAEPVPFRDPMPEKLKNKLKRKTRALIERARGREKQVWREVLTDEAENLWRDYYTNFRKRVSQNHRSFAVARQPEMTVRHALLFSLFHGETIITEDDLLRAIEVAKYLKNSAHFVLSRFDRKELSSCMRRVLNLLRKEGKMKKSKLSQRAASYCGGSVSRLDKVLDELEKLNHIDRHLV